MTLSNSLFGLWFLLGACMKFGFAQTPFELQTCSLNSVFDTLGLQCVDCTTTAVGAANTYVPGEKDAFGAGTCRCPTGRLMNFPSCSISLDFCGSPSCGTCSGNRVPSQDGTRCLQCGSSTQGISGTDCGCPSNSILVEVSPTGEYYSEKQCVACPSHGRRLGNQLYECSLCPDRRMSMATDGSCTCPANYEIVPTSKFGPGKCLSSSDVTGIGSLFPGSTAGAGSIVYRDVITTALVDEDDLDYGAQLSQHSVTASELVMYHGRTALVECMNHVRYFEDNSACNIVGHLCVLYDYDDSNVVSCSNCMVVRTHAYLQGALQHDSVLQSS